MKVICQWTYIHTYLHTYMHTCIHKYIHTYIPMCSWDIHTCIRTYPYIHTYINTYIRVQKRMSKYVQISAIDAYLLQCLFQLSVFDAHLHNYTGGKPHKRIILTCKAGTRAESGLSCMHLHATKKNAQLHGKIPITTQQENHSDLQSWTQSRVWVMGLGKGGGKLGQQLLHKMPRLIQIAQ